MKTNQLVIGICWAASACVGWPLWASSVYEVTSSYDAESQTWVGNVTEFTNAVATAKQSGDEIVLAKGVYDLSQLARDGVLAIAGSSTSYVQSGSILYFAGDGVILRGATGKPEDVLIKVDDNPGYRILATRANCHVRDVTMTGGYASSTYCGAWNYRSGGAIGIGENGVVISNCVFYGNKAGRHGGAVGGLNAKRGTVYDCVFYGNNGNSTGIAAAYSTFIRCVFTNNVTSEANTKENGIVSRATLYDCHFENNVGAGSGGVMDCDVCTNCQFVCNKNASTQYNSSGGGAATGSSCIYSNCYFYGNSGYRLGGVINGGSVYDCTIVSNCTRHVDASYGGGVLNAAIVSGCTIMSNIATHGGGVYGCALVTNCTISCNYAIKQGGAAKGCERIEDCKIAHNTAGLYTDNDYFGAGGVMGGCIYRCKFWDNMVSSVNQGICLVDSDVADGRVHCLTNINCVFHELHNQNDYVWVKGNVKYPEGHTISNMYAFGEMNLMRNCLITNCCWRSGPGNYCNSGFFSMCSGRVENCTIADNTIYWLVRHASVGKHPLAFVNCTFVDTKRGLSGERQDVTTIDAPALVLSNCVYGVMGDRSQQAEGFEDGTNFVIGVDGDPKFMGKGTYPYLPRLNSPLVRNKGLVLDWMTDGIDLAGQARLRDGAVDIGCYQCWLVPPPTVLLVR